MAHKLGVSGSTIFSDSTRLEELFWEGIEHIEIGEFSDQKAVEAFLKLCKEKQVGFGIHSPILRGESKYDLIEKARYDPSYAWEQLESEAKRMSIEGAKYILAHFPFFKAEVSGNTNEIIEEGLKKICRIQKKYSIPIICEPKLGFQRSVAGLNYLDQFPLSIWQKYNVGVCIDIGDYLIAVEDDIFRYIGKWREFIKVVHLHNIVYEPNTYIWTPVHPSDEQVGNHKVQKIIEFLAQSKDVTFVFEHTPERKPTKEYVMEGYRWVKSLICSCLV